MNKMKLSMFCFFTFNLVVLIVGQNSANEDLIYDLPGLNSKPKFHQYSGYLNASEDKRFHYWFIESQSYPETDPVILWLNGGPGCSSLTGLFKENGPFRVTPNGKNLSYHQFTWNTIASILYLESPVGVGYSYHGSDTKNLGLNDEQTAKDNYLALLKFFEKFPKFKNNKFYITGESYAGVYIPTLALEILNDNYRVNLKGIAIGNGYFDITITQNTRLYVAHYHGLIDTIKWNELKDKCCNCSTFKNVCDFMGKSQECAKLAQNAYTEATIFSEINSKNIYDECTHTGYAKSFSESEINYLYAHSNLNNNRSETEEEFLNNKFLSNSVTECVGDSYVDYLNDIKVREAIHIPNDLPKFQSCNRTLLQVYKKAIDVRKQFLEILTNHKIESFIVYNGDTDLVCDFIGNQLFLDNLNLDVIEKYKRWTLNGKTVGFVKKYKGLDFVTVRGAGHMVPTDRPESALHLIRILIGKSKFN